MSTSSQFLGAGIKSIQRGTIIIAGGTNSQAATITAVDTAKAQLRYLGAGTPTGTNEAHIVLTNSTTITAARGATGGNSTTVSWELTETY